MSAIENADKLQELSYVDLRHLVTEKYNDYTGLQKAYRQSMITKEQIEFLEANSFILAGLGPRIMRAETAPLYFLASLSFALELS